MKYFNPLNSGIRSTVTLFINTYGLLAFQITDICILNAAKKYNYYVTGDSTTRLNAYPLISDFERIAQSAINVLITVQLLEVNDLLFYHVLNLR